MLGDKAVFQISEGRSAFVAECEVRVSGGEVRLDTSIPGIISAVVTDRKGRERDRMVVSVGSLVTARLVMRR